MFKKEFNGFIIEIFREYFLNLVISIIIRITYSLILVKTYAIKYKYLLKWHQPDYLNSFDFIYIRES